MTNNCHILSDFRPSSTQFFIILHRWGVVGWHIYNIDKGSFNSKNLDIARGRTGFHQIIGYNYTTKSTSKSTVVENLPLARGTFSSQNFRRTVIYAYDKHRYQLPYHPAALQSGDDGFDTSHPSLLERPKVLPLCTIPSLLERPKVLLLCTIPVC